MKAEPVELGALVGSVAETLALLCEEKNQKLVLEPAEPVRTSGDSDLLYQAFFNILNNAIKYTPEGGNIAIRTIRRGDSAVVTFLDDGIGMTGEERQNAFNRFFRADSSRSLEKGYGLGLSISRWIVVLHGGTIGLEPGPAGGTLVTVTMPALPV